MRKWRSFIQTRAAFERRLVVGGPAQAVGELGAELGGAARAGGRSRRLITASSTPALRAEVAGELGRACRRCRRGGRAAAGSPPSARRAARPAGRRERKASSEAERRVGAGGAGDAAHELGLEAAEDARGRARCGARAGGASAAIVARGGLGVGEDRLGARARRRGAVVGTKKGSVSACDAWRGGRRGRRRRSATSVAAEVGEAGEARRRLSGRRWVWASSSICRRCSSSRWAT